MAKGYVGRWDGEAKKHIYLHRMINNTPKGMDTDHKNRNRLDNRRSNLRTFSRSQNMSNTMQKNNTSGYRGVSWHKQRNKWTSRAKINGEYKSLGLFNSKEEAYKVYLEAVALRFE